MSQELIDYYSRDCYEDIRLMRDNAHELEYVTSMKYLCKTIPKGAKILDACAGTGVYPFALANEGYRVTASDLVQHNLDYIHAKQHYNPILEGIHQHDIRNLSSYEDNTFDAVLCMGALYHLPLEEHPAAVRECLRVLRPGGIFAAAYISKFAQVLVGIARNGGEALQKYIDAYYTNYRDLFYRYAPDDIIGIMRQFPLKQLYNIGTDGIGYAIPEVINNLTPEQYHLWTEHHLATCEDPSILGYSLHALYIGQLKQSE